MKHRSPTSFAPVPLLCGLLLALLVGKRACGQVSPVATANFNAYVATLEARVAQQHRSAATLLAGPAGTKAGQQRLQHGELIVEQLSPPDGERLPGALLHHWRGSAFAPHATAAGLERLLRDFNAYPRTFAPEALDGKVLAQPDSTHLQGFLRVRQKHVLTVVMDTTYDVSFGQLDPRDGFSASRSTRIYEMAGAGTPSEHPLAPAEEHGFLWRLNSYWSYEERDGGLYLQVESVSLSRAIPTGLGWAIRPLVESIPRESLEFTLRSARNALQR